MKQSENRAPDRTPDGRFLPGHSIGKRWKPGETGNPNGRRGALRDLLNHLLDSPFNDEYTRRETLALALYEQALLGNCTAMRELLDRAEGKVKDQLQLLEAEAFSPEEIEAAATTIMKGIKNG